MPEDYDLEEVEVREVDDDDWGEPEWDLDEKMVAVFLGGAVLAWLWLTRPRAMTKDEIYAAELSKAEGR